MHYGNAAFVEVSCLPWIPVDLSGAAISSGVVHENQHRILVRMLFILSDREINEFYPDHLEVCSAVYLYG